MSKKLFMLLFLGMFFINFISAVNFFDDFEGGNLTTWNFTTVENNWTIETTDPYAGTYYAEANPRNTNEPASIMENNVSTVGYENINFSYFRKLIGLDAADEFKVKWWDGSSWIIVEETLSTSADDVSYVYKSFLLGSTADNNPDFKIRFECTAGAVSEMCRVDNVFVNGSTIITDTTSPIINSVIFDSDPIIVSTNLKITANITDDFAVDSSIIQIDNINYSMTQQSAVANTQETMFFDDFETGSLNAFGWILNGTERWGVNSADPLNGSNYNAEVQQTGAGDNSFMEISISTQSHENITFSYYKKLISLDAADNFVVEWYNGSSWNVLEQLGAGIEDDVDYVYQTFNLSTDANDNSNFKIRFMCEVGAVSEYCRIDNVSVSGILTSTSTSLWQYEFNPSSLGVYNYTIYANDTSDNNATPFSGDFSVIESNITVSETVRDANNTIINMTLEIEDVNNVVVYNQTSTSHNYRLAKGRYKIKIKPKNHLIKEIIYQNINLTSDVSSLIDIDDPTDNQGYNQLYAFNPLLDNSVMINNISNLTITLTASNSSKNKILYKCVDWDFANQNCTGNWIALQAITPGQNYTIVITNLSDPGLAEGDGIFFDGFENNDLSVNNWTSSGAGIWKIAGESSHRFSGLKYINSNNTGGVEDLIQVNISTENYFNIVFSFYYKTANLVAGDYIAADYYNGTVWVEILNTQGSTVWTLNENNLPDSANNNPNFKIRFRCLNDAASEECFVDNVQVDGEPDSIGPIINIDTPSGVYSNNLSIPLNYTVTDSSGIDSCWYNIDNGNNVTLLSCLNTTFNVSGDGSYVLNLYSNDTLGNENNNSVSFSVSLSGVSLSLSEPIGSKTSRTGIPLTYTTIGDNLTCWYNVHTSVGGIVIVNTTLTNCSSSSFDVSTDGNFVLNLYVNNSFGLLNTTNSSFNVDTSSSSSSSTSGGGGSSGGSSSGGGISLKPSMNIGSISDLVANKGDTKDLELSIENTGLKFLDGCKVSGSENYAEWISSSEEKGLAGGEAYSFRIKLNIPESAESGVYGLKVIAMCNELNESLNFNLEILEEKVGFKLIKVERFAEDQIKIIYSLEELSSINQDLDIQFLLFNSVNEKVAEIKDQKTISANSLEEFETLMSIAQSLEGELNLLININSDTYSGFVQENIIIGSHITGFEVFGEPGNSDNIFSGVLIFLFLVFAFFIIKRIFKHKRKINPKKRVNKKIIKENKKNIKNKKTRKKHNFIDKLYYKIFPKKDKRGIMLIDHGILEIIKKEISGKDVKGKWIRLNR